MITIHSLVPLGGVSPKQYLEKHGEELNGKLEPEWNNIPQDDFLVCSFEHNKGMRYAVVFKEGELAYYKSNAKILKYWHLPQENAWLHTRYLHK